MGMDISRCRCQSCGEPMRVTRLSCEQCNLLVEGEFEIPALARLPVEDQIFVVAFVRHHGSIKKMESLFDISYPTVKNRLNAIGAALDRDFTAPSANSQVLDQLARGEIDVDEALEKLS